MIDQARQLAVKILMEVYTQDAYANVALARNLRQTELTAQDRRFVTELVYGTVRAGETLDWILRRYVNRPLKKIEPRILAILRLGLYQLFYLDKVPASAACNTAVELAKKGGHRGSAGFVNAVLRTAVREPAKAAFPTGQGHATENLALTAQHPQWLVKHWVKTFGFDAAAALAAANNTEAPLCLRTNTLRTTPAELAQALAAADVTCMPSQWAPEGFVVTAHGALDALAPLQVIFTSTSSRAFRKMPTGSASASSSPCSSTRGKSARAMQAWPTACSSTRPARVLACSGASLTRAGIKRWRRYRLCPHCSGQFCRARRRLCGRAACSSTAPAPSSVRKIRM